MKIYDMEDKKMKKKSIIPPPPRYTRTGIIIAKREVPYDYRKKNLLA